jgi:hypothetical protein
MNNRIIRAEGSDWIISVEPYNARNVRRSIWETFSDVTRGYHKHEWKVKGWATNAARLLAFAAKHDFDVTEEARDLVEYALLKADKTALTGIPFRRIISEWRTERGRIAFLISFDNKNVDPDFQAIYDRVKALPRAKFLFKQGVWAVREQYQAEVELFAREFNFTLAYKEGEQDEEKE